MGASDNNKSSELGHVSSLRASVRFSNVQGDDDDYDLQAMGIADGFRPAEVTHTETSRPPTTITPQDAPTPQIPPPRPSSITKPHRRNESFTLQHDGSSTESDNDATPARISRVSSVSTTSPFVDPEDPYDGPSGPSHPYQMYPQDVRVVRTASLATTSTAPISERSYNGPRGPAHPYGMYPQNTIPEADGIPNRTAQGNITVGFPGTTDNYQRRIGPDGEDVADLIGPDGHTEQLPPYTRYPEETYNRKALGIEAPQPAPVQPMLAIPGAGGIGMATRNPEFASTEDLGDLNSPQSRQSVRSFASEGSQRELTATTRPNNEIIDEKDSLKDWQVTAKRRVWGIVPCWAIILASIVLVLMGVILGAVIGTIANPWKKGHPPDRPPSPAQSPTNWDTQPLSTLPPDLPPLPQGNFSMFLGRNNRISNTCFSDPTLSQAWSCDLTLFQLSMSIKRLSDEPNISDYSFGFLFNESNTLKNNVYTYGVQPPDLKDLKMKLVSDVFEAPRGPAWNFEVSYNKTAIIPEPFISPTSSSQNRRRMMFGGGGGDPKRRGIAQPGEKPWVCYWDNTILEAFIYAGQNNSFSRPGDPGSGPMTTVPASASTSGNTADGPAETSAGGTTDVPDIGNGNGFQPSYNPFDNKDPHTTSATDGLPTTTSAPASSSSDPFDKGLPMPISPLPPYPRVIKVEERRNAGSTAVKPWCRQYRITGENQAVPNRDANGNYIEVHIDEDEGDYGSSGESRRDVVENYIRARNSAKGTDMSDCGCIWWLS